MTLWNEWQKEINIENINVDKLEYSYPDDYVKWLEEKIIYLTKWIKIDHPPLLRGEYLVYGYDVRKKLIKAMELYNPSEDRWTKTEVIYPIAWIKLPNNPSIK